MVSVILPNFNHKSFLKERLDSIFNQTFQDFEVILLDDASTDGSEKLLLSYKDHPRVSHVVINKSNSGSPFLQWKKGISLAQGEWIWIAESDDFAEKDFLEILTGNIDENVGISYSQTTDVDESGQVILHRLNYTGEFEPNIWENNFVLNGEEFIRDYLSVKNVIPNASAVLFRKSLVDNNTFEPALVNMKMCGDWWFWIKLCEKKDIAFTAKPLNFFRNHSSMSRNHSNLEKKKIRLMEEVRIRMYLKHKLKITKTEVNKKIKRVWYTYFPIKAIFKNEFYRVHTLVGFKFSLAFDFIQYKIKNRLF